MDVYDSFLVMLFVFPPVAIILVACVVKLFVLLQESTMTWGRAFLIGVVFNVASIALYIYFL